MDNKFKDDLMERKLSEIPDKIMKSFSKRALRDAEKIIDVNDERFKDIAYSIFRGYCIGFTLGNIDKISKR